MGTQINELARAFRAAFPYTLPIFAGFWFLGFTYGIYMNAAGFGFVYPTVMALLIFGGSLEFVAVGMLLSPFAPLTALVVSLAVQARHLFYGISMLDRFRGTGWVKPYLIFGMCDETFSILCTTEPPEGATDPACRPDPLIGGRPMRFSHRKWWCSWPERWDGGDVLIGPGIREDGTTTSNRSEWSSFQVVEVLNGKHFPLIAEADWAVIRQAQDMVRAMVAAAHEIEESAS